MKTLLSTKILSLAQREHLLHAGLRVVDYNAIAITHHTDFDIDLKQDHYIFTSQNAVHAFLQRAKQLFDNKVLVKSCFCVGEKTKVLLEKNEQKVLKMTKNASELAKIIVKSHKNDSFLFFTGNLKRPELPQILTQNKVMFKEVCVYRTSLQPKKFDRQFDGVLFFSPSAVESFMMHNNLEQSIAFCIGDTTAKAAHEHAKSVIIANKPTIENTLIQSIKYFKTN